MKKIDRNRTEGKSKGTAILLAVLFGYWTWLYTYKDDATKFWVGMIVSIFGWLLLFIPNVVVWIWSMVDACNKTDAWYEEY